jgi:hypothetical protein
MTDKTETDDAAEETAGQPITRRALLALLGVGGAGAALSTGANNNDEPGGLSAGGGVPLERLDIREWWVATDASDMQTISLDARPAIVIVTGGNREGAYLYT